MERLKRLMNSIDIRYLLVIDKYNISYLLDLEVDEEAALLIDKKTSNNILLISSNVKDFSKYPNVIVYSIKPTDNPWYIIVESFEKAVFQLVKAFVPIGEEIGLLSRYISIDLLSLLQKFWKVSDRSQTLLTMRVRKEDSELNYIAEAASKAKEILEYEFNECDAVSALSEIFNRIRRYASIVEEFRLLPFRGSIIIELITKEHLYKAKIATTISFDRHLKERIRTIEMTVPYIIKTIRIGSPCSAFIERIENALRAKGLSKVQVSLCGIGIEVCEYPLTHDAIYRDCVIDRGYALYIEIEDLESGIRKGFTTIYRDTHPEIYG